MSFDNDKVVEYIIHAFHETHFDPENAWNYLVLQRGREDPHDDNDELAAAEHYMYARYQVGSGETGYYKMLALTAAYDGVKVGSDLIPAIGLFRWAIGYTWSTPSTESVLWGKKGCEDGEEDRKKAKP